MVSAASVQRPIAPAVGAGIVYAAAVFAAGFLMGAVRDLAIAPRWGAVTGVLVELPVILLIAWTVCGMCGRRFGVSERRSGLIMGVAAFTALQAMEFTLTVTLFRSTPGDFFAALATPAGTLGMAGEAVFGLFPVLRAGESPRPLLDRVV